MRCAATINWEAERERGMILVGPFIRVDLTPAQLVSIIYCVFAAARGLARMAERERSAAHKRTLLAGLRELLDIARALG